MSIQISEQTNLIVRKNPCEQVRNPILTDYKCE
jgi:hypothetical protein